MQGLLLVVIALGVVTGSQVASEAVSQGASRATLVAVTQLQTSAHAATAGASELSDKDIVSNVVKAVQITTQENIFVQNLFGVVSKISNLSLEATKAAVNIQVLNAYVELVMECLRFIEEHRSSGEKYKALIRKVLDDATKIMTESPG